MTPAARRMARLQRWNLERLPALTEQMFRAVLERADRAYEKLPGSTPKPDDTPNYTKFTRAVQAVRDTTEDE